MPTANLSFEAMMRRGGQEAVREASKFFMGTDRVHDSLRAVTARLTDLQIPYAVAGGMSLVAHGYDRTTEDVDILVSAEGLAQIHTKLSGLGYIAPFAGSKNLRDTTTGVRIEFLVSGGFPGDGKPKPVAFPDPADASIEIDGIRYLKLTKLIELKLASGMSAPHRLKDLADVQELIKAIDLPRDLADQLDPSVRGKFLELQANVREAPPEE